jgi:hypothetical protein
MPAGRSIASASQSGGRRRRRRGCGPTHGRPASLDARLVAGGRVAVDPLAPQPASKIGVGRDDVGGSIHAAHRIRAVKRREKIRPFLPGSSRRDCRT